MGIAGMTGQFLQNNEDLLKNSSIDNNPKVYLLNMFGILIMNVTAMPGINIFGIITSFIFGNKLKENKLGYQFPVTSLNLRDFWKKWSTHIGITLQNFIYHPFGGRKYPLISISSLFFTNYVGHVYINYMSNNIYGWKQWGLAFSLLSVSTLIDMGLDKYIKKEANKNNTNMISLINKGRWLLLVTTMIGWSHIIIKYIQPITSPDVNMTVSK